MLTALAVAVVLTASAFDSEAWLRRVGGFASAAASLRETRGHCVEADAEPAENVEVPFESWPNGAVKSAIGARKARFFLTKGVIWGEGVSVRQMRQNGTVENEILADDVVIDRATKTGWATGAVSGRYRSDITVSGSDVFFDFDGRCLQISSNTVLKASGDELRSRGAVYDSENEVAMFDGGVKLRHDEKEVTYDITCGRAFVFFSGTNDLRRIVALDGVTVVGGGRSGACDKAVYARAAGRLTLYGSADCPARLTESGERAGELQGAKITYWTDSGQVEVVRSCISVDAKELRLPGRRDGR